MISYGKRGQEDRSRMFNPIGGDTLPERENTGEYQGGMDHQLCVWLQQGWDAREGKNITWRPDPASSSIKNQIDK